MEAFLSKKGPLDAERAVDVHGKGPSKPSARPSNLLFNPQSRPRQRIPWPTSTSDENAPGRERQQEGSGGYASSYSKFRVSRLTDQAPTAVSQIFAGLSFYFNGRSGDKQTMHLKGGVSKHGGTTTPFMSMKGVTHVIAENLSATKTDKAMKSLKMKVVHPDWITRCMAEGKLLPDAPFRVVRSQKLRMDNFFSSGDGNSEKEKRKRGGKCASPGTPTAGGGEDRRRQGKVGSGGERREGKAGGRCENDRPGLAAPTAAAAAAAPTSSNNISAEIGGGFEVGSGTSSSLSIKGDAGLSGSGRDSSSCSNNGDAGRRWSGGGSTSFSSGEAIRNCSSGRGSSSSCRGSCKENGHAVGVFPNRDTPKASTRLWSEVAQEAGLHSSRSSHTAATARKRSRHTATPSPAVNGGWHDLTGDDEASPSSPSSARKRKNNAPLDTRNARPR